MIGGTRFIGRHVVEAALARGHEVTVFHRGRSGSDLFSGRVDRRIGDRDGDLDALAEDQWDATIDTCAYVPRHVQTLADVLGERGGHHLLVSSVSAYDEPAGPGFTEDSPLLDLDDPTTEQVTGETYGGLKVLCERAAIDRHGPRTIVVRPTYVIGPDDYTWRFPWWVSRIARGGEVPVPGPADAPMQVVDVRDMAAWMVSLLEQKAEGAFHAVGVDAGFTWRALLEAVVAAVGPPGTSLTWVDPVAATGLPEGTVPLWSGDESEVWILTADPARARATGLSARPLADTVRDTWAWTRTVDQPDHPGLTADQEAELLAAAQ